MRSGDAFTRRELCQYWQLYRDYQSQLHIIKSCLIYWKSGLSAKSAFAHTQELLNISVSVNNKNRTATPWKLQDDSRGLEALDVNDTVGRHPDPLILSRLPQDIRLEWAREGEGRKNALAWLLEYLNKEIRHRERFTTSRESSSSGKSKAAMDISEKRNVNPPITAAALQINSEHAYEFWGLLGSGQTKCSKSERYDSVTLVVFSFFEKKDILPRVVLLIISNVKGTMCCCVMLIWKILVLLQLVTSVIPRHKCPLGLIPQLLTTLTVNLRLCYMSVLYAMVIFMCHTSVSFCSVQRSKSLSKSMIEANVLFDTWSDRSYIMSSMVNKVAPKCAKSEKKRLMSHFALASQVYVNNVMCTRCVWVTTMSFCYRSTSYLFCYTASRSPSFCFAVIWRFGICWLLWWNQTHLYWDKCILEIHDIHS